jgi:hypothetical protein
MSRLLFTLIPWRPTRQPLFSLLLVAAMAVLLAGCGSTKVYTADKTILYNGALYNMSTVQRVGSRIEGQMPDGSTVEMRPLDKKGVQSLLEEHPEIMVSTVVEMDQQEMVYQRVRITKYSDYNRMVNRFDDALEDITDFMANKKKTQLKLR